MRVYLDTNVLVSAFTTRGLSADVVRLILLEHELVTGEVNLAEFRRVLQVRMGVPEGLIAEAEQLLPEQDIVPVPAAPHSAQVRDPDDARVLASALEGGADALVTGDRDLLDLGSAAPLPILSPRGFWEQSRRGPR